MLDHVSDDFQAQTASDLAFEAVQAQRQPTMSCESWLELRKLQWRMKTANLPLVVAAVFTAAALLH